MRFLHPRDQNKYIRRQIVFSSDLEFKKRFLWRTDKFKEPFLGFEEDMKLREFRKFIEEEIKKEYKEPTVFTEIDFQRIEFKYRMFLKTKLYNISVRSTFAGDVFDLEMPFFQKEAWHTFLQKKMLVHMYARAVKLKLDAHFNLDYYKKRLEEDVKEKQTEEMIEQLTKEKDYKKDKSNLWLLNKRVIFEFNEVSKYTAEDVLSYLLDDLSKEPEYYIEKKNNKNIEKKSRYPVVWTEATIPYFLLNFSTGALNYDFWNNSDERVEKRKKTLRLILKGKKTWTDFKKLELKIALFQLRGVFGTFDYALCTQKKFLNKSENVKYLPNYAKIYNWFQNPMLANNYSKLVYGLVGPSLIPHWCLLFTMTKTKKNIYFTVSDMVGKTVLTVSAGSFNIHKRKRMSPYALEPLYQKVLLCLTKLKVKNVIIVMKFKAKYLYLHTVKFFRTNRISIKMVLDKLPIPHNGIRARKPKRL